MQNKPVAEYLPQVRVSDLKQQGLFGDDYWQNAYNSGSSDPFSMFGQTSNEFRYTLKVFGHRKAVELGWDIGEGQYLSKVELTSDKVNFGGYRYWFICPNCSSRCGVLYILQEVCGCNKCLAIAYASQNRTKGKQLTLDELGSQSKKLTDTWLALWRKNRFFYDNRPTKEYLSYLVAARDIWSIAFLNPESSVLMYQAHDPTLFKPPHVFINGH